MSVRRFTVGLAVVVLLGLGACDGEPRGGEQVDPVDPVDSVDAVDPVDPVETVGPGLGEATSAPTVAPGGEPTVASGGEPEPELATTGEDLEGVVRSRYAYRSWLFRNPHPDNATVRLARITDPGCICWEADHRLLAHYAEEGLWWTGAELRVVSVEVVDRSHPDLAVVGITDERDGVAQLIDRTGEVLDELPPGRVYYEVVLVRDDSESPWRTLSTGEGRPVSGEEDGEEG